MHKLVYEHLGLIWKGFLEFSHEGPALWDDTRLLLEKLHEKPNQESLDELLHNPSCDQLLQHFFVYLDNLRSNAGQLAQFWMSHVDMIQLLLNLVRASGDGDWTLHLSSVCALLPCFFA